MRVLTIQYVHTVYVKLSGATESPLLLTEIIGTCTNWVMINDVLQSRVLVQRLYRMYSIV